MPWQPKTKAFKWHTRSSVLSSCWSFAVWQTGWGGSREWRGWYWPEGFGFSCCHCPQRLFLSYLHSWRGPLVCWTIPSLSLWLWTANSAKEGLLLKQAEDHFTKLWSNSALISTSEITEYTICGMKNLLNIYIWLKWPKIMLYCYSVLSSEKSKTCPDITLQTNESLAGWLNYVIALYYQSGSMGR